KHPRVDPAKFDLVTASAHDRLTGPNVRTTLGALHHVTREKLAAEARKFEARYAHLPRPLVAVLIGGANRVYRFDRATAERLADGLARICEESGCGLLITASRRTGPENEALLRERLKGLPAEIWDGAGDNPYFAFLGLADSIIVTGDSVNMVSEACYTGKPVHVFHLPGGGGTKFLCFHESLVETGITRPFKGWLENWQYDPLDERTALASEIRGRLDEHAGSALSNGN
ncbi:MAG: mitochondrial fission ELM1 family protein, partial [Alphaproteobacteria bacterium]|nr:mitochondrial fission ELM1 family protein [Alphaproteobacteria bacterium]